MALRIKNQFNLQDANEMWRNIDNTPRPLRNAPNSRKIKQPRNAYARHLNEQKQREARELVSK